MEEALQIFLPIPGRWGKMGRTHIRLAAEHSGVTDEETREADYENNKSAKH